MKDKLYQINAITADDNNNNNRLLSKTGIIRAVHLCTTNATATKYYICT